MGVLPTSKAAYDEMLRATSQESLALGLWHHFDADDVYENVDTNKIDGHNEVSGGVKIDAQARPGIGSESDSDREGEATKGHKEKG